MLVIVISVGGSSASTVVLTAVAKEQPFASLAITLTVPEVLVTKVSFVVKPRPLKLYWYGAVPPAPTAVTIADCVTLPVPQDNGVVTPMVADTTAGSAITIAAAAREVHPFASVITTV